MDVNYLINQPQPDDVLTPEVQEEFVVLMSLSLDNLLDGTEAQRFQTYLARYSTLADQWRSWQLLDRNFTLTPAAEPAAGFVQRFETRLAQKSSRHLFWRNLLIAALIVAVWGTLLIGGATLAAYVMLYQGNWLGEFVHTAAYCSATVMNWLTTAINTLGALATTPQAISFFIGYIIAAGALLFLWVRFLRNTTQEVELA